MILDFQIDLSGNKLTWTKYKSHRTEGSVEDNGAQLIVMLIGLPVNHLHHLHLHHTGRDNAMVSSFLEGCYCKIPGTLSSAFVKIELYCEVGDRSISG